MADATRSVTLRVTGVSKRFGTTQAVEDASFVVRAGELIGIAGHNGAGKTTLLNVVAGQLRGDSGTVDLAGQPREATAAAPAPNDAGIRIVHQELSLSPALRVDETAAVFDRKAGAFSWRRQAWRKLRDVLDEMFPGHGIRPGLLIGDLSISRRQMIECACAMLSRGREPVLLILDEPTSSLGNTATQTFYAYLRKRAEQGLSAIITTHRLNEMVHYLDRIYVMRDGKVISEQGGPGTTKESLVRAMGVGAHEAQAGRPAAGPAPAGRPVAAAGQAEPAAGGGELRVEIAERDAGADGAGPIRVRAGEIVGLAGLEGHGQLEVLEALSHSAASPRRSMKRTAHQQVRVTGSASYVSGDRRVRGIFRYWSLAGNVSISSLRAVSTAGFVSPAEEAGLAARWAGLLGIKAAPRDPITSLSGGTQQKALMARALAAGGDVLLLEDPTRGVDQSTKDDVYALLREQASQGKCVIWYSTENDELQYCDRILVFRGGRIVGTLLGPEASEDAILSTSFAGSV